MRVGERYRVTPLLGISAESFTPSPMIGTIIYVHPKYRFAVLEFECLNGKGRECFYPKDLRNPLPDKRGRR